MVTVFDIVTSPTFKNFQIISGEKGIQNPVSGTGIFDWESKADIAKSFRKGEFVITTLTIAKDDFDYANDCIKTLILHGVAAICIKEVFFRNLSEDTIQKSDILGVPIFFFSDTFVDDIVYEVRNLLASDQGGLQSNLYQPIKDTLAGWYGNGAIDPRCNAAIQEILHPYLHDTYICLVGFPKNSKAPAPVKQPPRTGSQEQSIIVSYESGVVMVLSYPATEENPTEKVADFLDAVGISAASYHLGQSSPKKGIYKMANAILEGFLACTASMVSTNTVSASAGPEGENDLCVPETLSFLSIENLLISNAWAESSRRYFDHMYQIITSYDQEHDTDFIVTLTTYIEADGDLVRAAKLLFQHPNTVRYRVAKIKSLLGIESPNSYMELYAFVKLMEIYQIFETTFGLESPQVGSNGPTTDSTQVS